jgi:hypothetical protein
VSEEMEGRDGNVKISSTSRLGLRESQEELDLTAWGNMDQRMEDRWRMDYHSSARDTWMATRGPAWRYMRVSGVWSRRY